MIIKTRTELKNFITKHTKNENGYGRAIMQIAGFKPAILIAEWSPSIRTYNENGNKEWTPVRFEVTVKTADGQVCKGSADDFLAMLA